MKNILIPIDFSENSKNGIRYALNMFKETTCHFFLLYVNLEGSDFTEKPVYEFGTSIIIENEPKGIGSKLKDLEEFITSLSVSTDQHDFTTIRTAGYFLKTIRKYIKENEIDLIVMGTRGAAELKEFFLGTRTGDVLTKVECDVLVVPEQSKYKALEEIVLSVDFEINYDDTTLTKIIGLITSNKTKIKLLYVTKSQLPLFEEIENQQKQLSQRLSELLPNPITFHRIVSKKIEDGIGVFAESIDADLIIMISKDYGLLNKWFLDTTVEEVSFETRIPLLSLQG